MLFKSFVDDISNDTHMAVLQTILKMYRKRQWDEARVMTVAGARYKLVTWWQGPDETIDQFLTEIKVLASACELGDLDDSLLQTVIMTGVSNSALCE